MNDISEFNKLCINYLRDNKIDMSQYTELLNIDIFNVKKVCDYVNNLDNNFKDMFYNHYKNLIKYKDNKLIFKNKILLQRLLELAQQNNFNFTKNQTEIINELIRFMTDDTQKYYGLFGYAGTGKTTSLVALITYMLELKYVKSIIFTSPTNKALNVIKNKFINSLRYLLEKHNIEYAETKTFDDNIDKLRKHNINIEFSTIHKLLNYKTEFNQNGEMVFIKEKDSDLKKYDIIIIDESSMVSINLIYDIIKDTDKINTKIIFAGDPAQLPPVNEHISSIFMNENTKISHSKMTKYILNLSESNYINFCETIINMNKFTLNEIIRTKNPSIIDSCNTIRNWIQNRSEFTDIQKYEDSNIILYPNDKTKKTKTLWYKKFEHKILDENDTIIISWTNGETDMYNNYYRNTLFNSNKSIDVFMEGDILILNEFYNINCNKFNTSEKIVVIEVKQDIFNIENLDNKINKAVRILKNARSIETRFKNFIENINKNKNSIPIYKLKVKKIDEPDKTYDINVIRKESLEYHKELMFNVSDSIRAFRNNIIDVTTNESLEYNLIQPLWKDFNNKYIDPFATVSYGYAITCHKAQGSNYKNVFVDFSDIVKNKNEEEMKRCMYTAMSRTIDTLHILI